MATVREGRHLLENIQRAFLYLIAFHVPIVILAVAAPLTGAPLLLLPVHLVWLELIVHPVSAVVFQAEEASAATMSRPPRDPRAPLLSGPSIRLSATTGFLLAAVAFLVYVWALPAHGLTAARGLACVVLLMGYQALMFVERLALRDAPVSRVPRSATFWMAWAATLATLAGALYIPTVGRLLGIAPSSPGLTAAAALAGTLVVAWRLVPWSGTALPRPAP